MIGSDKNDQQFNELAIKQHVHCIGLTVNNAVYPHALNEGTH